MHCQVCGKTFRLRAQLNAHLRSHSDEKPFKCDNCEKAFKYTWNLNKHKREQCSQKIVPHEKSSVPDSNFPPKFKCPICFRIFKYSYNRTRHLLKHKHGNAVDLKNSSSAVERPSSQKSDDKDARLPFSCRFCGRAFASPDSLKKHLQLHKGNKPFRCLDCGKNFARHGHLMAHKNVHRRNSHPKKGILKCPDCPMQFKFPVFLLRHVAVH
uniref:C2H2-type domain-containing protein n=1 Tax=Cyprinus carpio TaxID=7962 RepID=A0A8C2FGT1_CYPCA